MDIINLKQINQLIANENISAYSIEKEAGFSRDRLAKIRRGDIDLDNVSLKSLKQLQSFINKEVINMNTNEIKLNALTVHMNDDYTVSHLTVSNHNLTRYKTPITEEILDYLNDALTKLLTKKASEWLANGDMDTDQDGNFILMEIKEKMYDYLASLDSDLLDIQDHAQQMFDDEVLELTQDYFRSYKENLNVEELAKYVDKCQSTVQCQPSDQSLWVDFWREQYQGEDRDHFECADLTLPTN